MTFHEKLTRRVKELGLNKARAARDSGLPESTISSYISNAKSLPRLDIAAKIARAIQVPLEWLADDTCEWPPPPVAAPPAAQLDNETLMLEVARRYRLDVLDFFQQINRARTSDLKKTLGEIDAWLDGQAPSTEALLVATLFFQYAQLVRRWTVQSFADERHASLPGSSLPVEQFDLDAIAKRFDKVAGDGVFQAMQQSLFGLLGKAGVDELMRTQHRKRRLDAAQLPE